MLTLHTGLALGLSQVHLLADWVGTIGLDTVHQGVQHLSIDGLVLAQNTDADLVEQAKEAWATFVETGQIWAFLIGTIIGYTLRVFTTYG
ncbi:MAG: hypothetical protein ACO34J_16375 [Prochlorothrix sp.]